MFQFKYLPFLVLLLAIWACKKEADIPEELSPQDFYVQYALADTVGLAQPYSYEGGQRYDNNNNAQDIYTYGYSGGSGFVGDYKYVNSSIEDANNISIFKLTLIGDQIPGVLDAKPDWSKEELENFLTVGKHFSFGDGPGQATFQITDHPGMAFKLTSTSATNLDGELVIESVEDYGSPDAGIPYVAKRVKIRFSGSLFDADSFMPAHKKLILGKAALFFPYY